MDDRAKPVVGLDFGTSTSLVASVRGVVPIGDFLPWLPSLIGIHEDGNIAIVDDVTGLPEEQVVRSIKRSITDNRDFVRVDTASGLKDLKADDLIVAILREVVHRAESRAPGLVTQADVRLGCPAMWNGRQRRRLLAAAQRAGLSVELASLVDEPVAAGIAWLAQQDAKRQDAEHPDATAPDATIPEATAPMRVVVFDMGGGTLDIAVLGVRGGDRREVSVLAAVGLAEAGDALDDKIAEDLDYLLAAAGVDIDTLSNPGRARGRLRDAAPEAKIALSHEARHPVDLPSRLFGIPSIWYSREQLNEVFAKQMDTAEMYVVAALKAARLTELQPGEEYDILHAPIDELTAEVTHVVLSGGMSQIPYVAERLRDLFPATTTVELASTPPENGVVLGLALAAEYGRINMYRPPFDIYLDWPGQSRLVYEAYTPLFESRQIARGGSDVGYRRLGADLSLPRRARGTLRVVSHSGKPVRATLDGRDLDGFPVALSGEKFEFRVLPNGYLRMTDAKSTVEGRIDDWR